jgi:hypothetical protein
MDNNTHDPGIDYIDGKWSYVDFLSIEEGMKIKSKHCKSCVFDNICSGVWSEYKLFYDFNKDAVPIKGD